MRSWFSRAGKIIRWSPLLVLVMASAYVFTTAQSASAADSTPFNGCTTTVAFSKLWKLVLDSILNPIKHYGWGAFFVVVVIAVLVGVFASNRGGMWGKVLGLFCLMVIIVPLAAKFTNYHVGGAC